jgi:UDP:flavonoid glycosyltransferase YjiC (YdhE family)
MSRPRRVLIFACGNTLSHVAQALAIAEELETHKLETHVAFAPRRVAWAAGFFPRCHSLPELWEASAVPFPCLAWFADSGRVESCLAAQEKLVRELKPGLVIGIFDFLSKAAARDLPFVTVNGGCMLPFYPGVLGCEDTFSNAAQRQWETMDRFWQYAARHLEPALRRRHLPAPERANEMLLGNRNLIYEIEELCGVSPLPENTRAIGPIFWSGWERVSESPPELPADRPTVYLNAGTLSFHQQCLQRLMTEIMKLPVRLLASLGQGVLSPAPLLSPNPYPFVRPFLSPRRATSIADVVVCSGGIGTCYQNLSCRVPSLVVPMHPEQATNGIHLERHGCGRVLVPDLVFLGRPKQYASAIQYEQFRSLLGEMLEKKASFSRTLEAMSERVTAHDAPGSVRQVVEEML